MEEEGCRKQNHDEMTNQKRNEFSKRFGVATILIFRKLWKTIKIRQAREKLDFGSGSQLHVGKVLAVYNAYPRAILLIKHAS